jgi:hypothetical protein
MQVCNVCQRLEKKIILVNAPALLANHQKNRQRHPHALPGLRAGVAEQELREDAEIANATVG